MQDLPEDMRMEVEELPGGIQKFWWQAFWRAWLEVGGDVRRAGAKAWQRFARMAKGGGRRWSGDRGGMSRKARRDFCQRVRLMLAQLAEDDAGEGKVGREVAAGCGVQPLASGPVEAEEVLDCYTGEMAERLFEEAVARGWLKPEQRLWVEVYARRDWEGLRSFLGLAAAAVSISREGGRQEAGIAQCSG